MTMLAQSAPGGRGSSGFVQPCRGSARKTKNKPAGKNMEKYVPKLVGPPVPIPSIASFIAFEPAVGVSLQVMCIVRSTINIESALPVGEELTNSLL